jgi:hypothetical protein
VQYVRPREPVLVARAPLRVRPADRRRSGRERAGGRLQARRDNGPRTDPGGSRVPGVPARCRRGRRAASGCGGRTAGSVGLPPAPGGPERPRARSPPCRRRPRRRGRQSRRGRRAAAHATAASASLTCAPFSPPVKWRSTRSASTPSGSIAQLVAAPARDDLRVGARELLAQLGDQHLHELRCRRGRRLSPQPLDQPVDRHRHIRVQCQHREQRTWLPSAQRQGVPIVRGLNETQKTDLHGKPSLGASLSRFATTPNRNPSTSFKR